MQKDEAEVFFLHLERGEFGVEPPGTEDVDRTFDEFRAAVEFEQAGGGPVLPRKETRLRSERDDEPFTKTAAISQYLERRRAAGASVHTIIRELTKKCETLDPELISMLKGENQ
jgi:hypothetical protein